MLNIVPAEPRKERPMSHQPARRPRLSHYELGATSLFASQVDQRFSYCLYVPQDVDPDGSETYPLAVIVHGTLRSAQAYRDAFADFAETHRCVILAPLFPCGIIEPGDLNNYKWIKFHDIRFDHLLLGMVDEIAGKYPVDGSKFLLFGFSGGGQFVHRFFYLHPERLLGVSIGAPGKVTLLDTSRDWWPGVRDIEQQFGKPLNWDAMRQVAVQMVVGGADVEEWEINDPNSPMWVEGADVAGRNRVERLKTLKGSFEQAGIPVRFDVVPGVAHEGFRVLEPVKTFFGDVLTAAGLSRADGDGARGERG